MNKHQLASKIWESANKLRSKIEANEYKDYILGFIFYKFLSDKEERFLRKDGWEDDDFKELTEKNSDTVEYCRRQLGYFIAYDNLFSTWMKKGKDFNVSNVTDALSAFNRLIGLKHKNVFEKIFDTLDTSLTKLGDTSGARTKAISNLLQLIKDIPMDGKADYDVLGFIYEYLISNFAANAGKKAGEFYTATGPAELLCRLTTIGLTDVLSAADPTCGSGSLLLRLNKYANVRTFFGQELTSTTYNLARMNMILHGVPYQNFTIYNGDTLEDDHFEENKFRIQVANPPYSAKWSADKRFEQDERFSVYGKLAPKSKADFAFLQHMIYHMDDDGRIAILLPHGVLFRGAAEEKIRRYIIEEQNYLDAVIGLPANLFFGTSIPVCILVLKKDRAENKDNIFFIDASKEFESGKNQNRLRREDINKIVDTYIKREDVEKYAHKATMDEIAENDFNLNIPRYVDTFEEEPEVDLDKEFEALAECMRKSDEIDEKLDEYFEELGLGGFKAGEMA